MVKVKIYAVVRLDTGVKEFNCSAKNITEVIGILNEKRAKGADEIRWKDIIVFVNGERISSRRAKLNDGDKVDIMSPVSGG
ncbi:MAG: MoaD/ThiS family protein [Clostridia bacterium]|nr:MoaD/ThiS family protein [Clostridia bacterium]